jgi:hypothetical protein
MADNKQKQLDKQAARQAINRYTKKTLSVSMFLNIPFLYVTSLLVIPRFSHRIAGTIMFVQTMVTASIIMKLIRIWLYKKPSDSAWFTVLD